MTEAKPAVGKKVASKADIISVPASSGSSLKFVAVAAAAVIGRRDRHSISKMWLQRAAAVSVVQTQEPAPAPAPKLRRPARRAASRQADRRDEAPAAPPVSVVAPAPRVPEPVSPPAAEW